jgi:putative ABC transport system permease protein
VDEIALDWRAVAASLAACVLAILLFGLLPALRPARETLTGARKEGAGTGTGPTRRRVRSGLVVVEFALALTLLAGAALLLRSLLRVQQVKPGLGVDHLLAVPIEPPSPRYDDPARALALYRAAAEAAGRVPGVRSVALTNHVPLSGASMSSRIEIDGAPPDPSSTQEALFREVDPAYFRTAGIPLLAGRELSEADLAAPGGAVLVNEALAQRYWPARNPVGRRLTVYKSAQGRADFGEAVRATVIGVVGNVRHFALDTDFVPEVYLPYTVTVWPRMAVLARVEGDATRAALELEQAVLAVEPDLPLRGASFQSGVYRLTESLRESLAYRRLLAGLLGAFAALASLLAALGIFGVVAYLVTQREHEIAIRVALGASRRSVVRMVLGQGLRLGLIGVGIGGLGALAGTRLLRAQLYEVSPMDPVSLLGAACALTLVGLVATYLPARRAAGYDPMRALRSE